ncbi:MAG: Ger(x)C family spore germination protein [Bacillota bacterium]
MKKILCLILCTVMMLTLPGCWSRKEPKTLAIVNSVIYDYKDGKGYEVTTEIMNPTSSGGPGSSSGDGKSANITTISTGPTVPEAIRNASESLERAIFGGHNMVRFLSERLVQRDITPLLDYLLRDFLTDENPWMVVLKGDDPRKIYSCMLGLSNTVGDYIDSLAGSQPDILSKSVFVSTLDFIKGYYDKGIQPVAGVVQMVECESKGSNSEASAQDDSEKKYRILYEGLAAFKDNKLVGYLDGLETRAYNLVTNNVDTSPISIPVKDEFTVVLIKSSKSDIQTTVEGEEITINVRIKAGLSLIQEGGSIDISKMEPLKTVEDGFNKQLSMEIASTIRKVQSEFQSDIFGFGKALHAQHPEKWREIKENWDDYFSKAAVNVSVESTVNRSGQIKQPFMMQD